MPYISQGLRLVIDRQITALSDDIWNMANEETLAGILNYTVTELLNQTIMGNEPRYHKINTVLGILEAVKLELYRRLGGPYEDTAIVKNGDIKAYSQ